MIGPARALFAWLLLVATVHTSARESAAVATDEYSFDNRRRRRLGASLNAFAIVHDWIKTFDTSEQEEYELEVMEPKEHVLYGRSVPIDTSGLTTRIVGGDATETAVPWFVMLLEYNADSGKWRFAGCGGTLIASNYVLTAAHCVDDKVYSPSQTGVLVQAFRPFLRGNGGLATHFSRVEYFQIHNEYSSARFDKDVALIRLARPLDVESFPPVRLAESNFGINTKELVTIYGFGLTEEDADAHSSVLREVDVPFVSADSCRGYYGYQIKNDMVCAGLQQGGKDSCAGDSGGPLVKKVNDESYQLGIISWGDGCARANKPGVYTSVSFYYRWIADRVCADPDLQVELEDSLCRIETLAPTHSPTSVPTEQPIATPVSRAPTRTPSQPTTAPPTGEPVLTMEEHGRPLTDSPGHPTRSPSKHPTSNPSRKPTRSPFASPTSPPSTRPTQSPIRRPTRTPTLWPTRSPTARPTRSPTSRPSNLPVASSTSFLGSCLATDSPCLPGSGPLCCNGSCEWWGNSGGDEFFLCSGEDWGKKGKSKMKKGMNRRGR